MNDLQKLLIEVYATKLVMMSAVVRIGLMTGKFADLMSNVRADALTNAEVFRFNFYAPEKPGDDDAARDELRKQIAKLVDQMSRPTEVAPSRTH
jgi:hypothetical protein